MSKNKQYLLSRCIILAWFCLVSVSVFAQLTVTDECKVKNGDLTARKLNDTHPYVENGDTIPFALVRVGLAEPGVTFDSKWVLKTEFKDNEYWVYFMGGVKSITIKSKRFTPLHYSFPQPLEEKVTYIMTVQKPKADESQFGELEIKSNVAVADLYIDGVKISDGAPYTYKGEGGKHTLDVKADGYAGQTREVEIPVGHKASVTVNLFAEGSLDVNGVSYGQVPVAATSFQMGSNSFYYEQPIRQIKLMPFSIGITLVSVDLWKNVMGGVEERIKGADGQVVNITFDECMDFIAALNEQTGKSYRLPTEAEWEHCANNATSLGIGDIGKCMEWCSDWFGKYQLTTEASPKGPQSGIVKVVRGGSLYNGDWTFYNRSTYRWHQHPEKASDRISFRLVSDE